MSVSIGAKKFDGLIGPGPELPRVKPIVYTRPGTQNVGARIQPSVGVETEVRVSRLIAASSRFTEANSYRSLIGTLVAFVDGSNNYTTTYSVNFLILDVMIEESKIVGRVVGRDPDGNVLDLASGAKIVSRWRMIAVPSA
jgi:hypothetical protein